MSSSNCKLLCTKCNYFLILAFQLGFWLLYFEYLSSNECCNNGGFFHFFWASINLVFLAISWLSGFKREFIKHLSVIFFALNFVFSTYYYNWLLQSFVTYGLFVTRVSLYQSVCFFFVCASVCLFACVSLLSFLSVYFLGKPQKITVFLVTRPLRPYPPSTLFFSEILFRASKKFF